MKDSAGLIALPTKYVLRMFATKPRQRLSLSQLSFTILEAPAHGNLTLDGESITYQPTADYFGEDMFTYQVCVEGTESCGSGEAV